MLRKPSIDVIFPLVLLLLLIVENYANITEAPTPQPQPNTNSNLPSSVDLAALIDAPRQPSRSHACSSARKCCAKCLCVPAGTYGNKQSCPCYNNWKTKRGGPKCP
ncbi:GIBBERELLIN-REGULATED PROTEIN 13 [Salix purpurea]|uniref:GIBBERELLIN-REGULATED PROTEIN 13 n=1 Tax=Salix purpurea TaxID=77065 RepID=A0A9Q0Q539_SALPP|nr:GIBBERELLIN-REGULATED PROTEIN 13 [Salix purpurea]